MASRPDLLLGRNGRLYISDCAALPHYTFAGGCRLDTLASQRTVTGFTLDSVLSGDEIWTGSLTARFTGGAAVLARLGIPLDLLVLYGSDCDVVSLDTAKHAVVVEDGFFSGSGRNSMTTMASGEGVPVDDVLPFSGRTVYDLPLPASLRQIATTPGCVVAIAAGPLGRIYALAAAPNSSNHDLTLCWTEGSSWYGRLLGTFAPPASLTRYSLAAVANRIFIAVGAKTIMVDEPAAYNGRPFSPLTIAPPGVTPSAPLGVLGVPGGAIVAMPDGGRWALDKTARAFPLPAVAGVSAATFVGQSLDKSGVVFGKSGALVAGNGSFYSRSLPLPSGTPVAVHLVAGANGVLVAADNVLYELTSGGYVEIFRFARCILAMRFASRSIGYALVGAGDTHGSELWVTVNGGKEWRQVPSGMQMDYCSLCVLPDGSVLAGGQVAPGTGDDRCSGGIGAVPIASSGRIFSLRPPEQAIATGVQIVV